MKIRFIDLTTNQSFLFDNIDKLPNDSTFIMMGKKPYVIRNVNLILEEESYYNINIYPLKVDESYRQIYRDNDYKNELECFRKAIQLYKEQNNIEL